MLKSLHEKFQAKVILTKKNKNIHYFILEELIWSLPTFEIQLYCNKGKGLGLKSIEEDIESCEIYKVEENSDNKDLV